MYIQVKPLFTVILLGLAIPFGINAQTQGIHASPSSLTFASQSVGTTSPSQQITLQDTSQYSILITSITVSGDFAQSNDCSGGIAFAQHCTMSVTFTPTVAGTRTGLITIKYKEGSATFVYTLTINLSGTATTTPAPNITTLSPSSAPIGASVTITGTNFGATQGSGSVTFNSTTATVSSWNSTTIVVSVPSGISSVVTVVVHANGLSSYGTYFHVLPVISGVSPASGAVGTSVTISGTGFGYFNGGDSVTFNGAAGNSTSWNPTSIVVPVPSGATSGNLVVDTFYDSSNGVYFSVTPVISGLSPNSGPVGTSVTISGTGFGGSQGSSTVTFNGVIASPTSWTATSINAPVPSGATTGNVVVTAGGLISNGVNFTVMPVINSLSPTSGLVGASVTISGAGFGSSQGGSTVAFNGTAASPTSWSTTSITAPVPIGATTGNVVVTVSGVASNGLAFTVVHQNLILGGAYGTGGGSSYEIRDDSSNLLADGTLSNPLANHSAILLKNGNVFVAGGAYDTTLWQIFSAASGNLQLISSGLLQNSVDSSFSVLLANGNVMVGGGAVSPSTWEIHSPNGALVSSGSLNGARTPGASAVRLQNGNVWISGSAVTNPDACTWEIHDSNGNLVSSGSLNTCFAGGKLQVLSNGNIILLGGDNAPGAFEIYTQTGVYVKTGSMINGFNRGASVVALSGGKQIFIFGSCSSAYPDPSDPHYKPPACANIGAPGAWEFMGFDTNSNVTFDTTGSLFDTRSGARAIVTSNGNILITGGQAAPQTWEMWAPSGTSMTFVGQGGLWDVRNPGHSTTHQ